MILKMIQIKPKSEGSTECSLRLPYRVSSKSVP